jgi:beta-ribofuranosylaminobenzene 5'-phosphate synthase
MSAPMKLDARAAVTVRAPARLHLGFLDPSATLGRAFGSLGLVLEAPETEVELMAAPADEIVAATDDAAAEAARAAAHLQRLRERTGRTQPLRLRLLQVLPAHAGFGSGTQLALAIGRAFACWHGLDLDSATLARWLGRGLRSGIGIAGFDHGGLLVDGGPAGEGKVAPLLSRIELPPSWRVVVVEDPRRQGLSGSEERRAIGALAALPQAHAADLCHQVLMRVLPGAAGDDFPAFAAGINRVQQVLGEHFAPAQDGSAYSSAAVACAVERIAAVSRAAVGQSSWGPTGFAILPSQANAEAAVAAARAAGAIDAALVLRIAAANRRGAVVVDGREQRRRA